MSLEGIKNTKSQTKKPGIQKRKNEYKEEKKQKKYTQKVGICLFLNEWKFFLFPFP